MSSSAAAQDRIASLGRFVVLAAGATYLVTYLAIALLRLPYPFELEWMEGGSVIQVQRILDGQSLYVPPSLNYVPFIYSPLYFYVGAAAARVAGNGFLTLRLVSFLASLGSLAFIFLIVRRRTASPYAALVAATLFAATFRISGAWFDLARVDSLFLVLLLAGIHAFGSPRPWARSLAAPVLLFLSCLTKQTALIPAVGLAAAALLTRKGPERFLFGGVFGVLMAAAVVGMNAVTDGWYRYYVFDLPAQHELEKAMWLEFWTSDIARNMPIAFALAVVPFARSVADGSWKFAGRLQDVAILGSVFAAAWFSRLHTGGYDNVLMPVYAGIAIYAGIGLASGLEGRWGSDRARVFASPALAVQFAMLFYSPALQVPSTEDRQQGDALEQLIAGFPGEVYISDHPWYAGRLHKATQAQDMAVRDILRAPGSVHWQFALANEMEAAVAQGRYEAFIVDFSDFMLRVPEFDARYELVRTRLSGSAFHPVTGWDRRPLHLYVRRPAPAGALPAPD